MKKHYYKFRALQQNAVLNGLTCQSIRRIRKKGPAVGDLIVCQTWVGKAYGKGSTVDTFAIGKITQVSLIELNFKYDEMTISGIYANGDRVARSCGFSDFTEMASWLKSQYDLADGDCFEGELVRWELDELRTAILTENEGGILQKSLKLARAVFRDYPKTYQNKAMADFVVKAMDEYRGGNLTLDDAEDKVLKWARYSILMTKRIDQRLAITC